MSTLNLQVGYDADDCYDSQSAGFYLNEAPDHIIWIGIHSSPGWLMGGFRFRNVTIPAGSTINSAALQLYADASEGGPWTFKVVGEAADNPGVWAETSHEPGGISETTAKVDWDTSTWTADTWRTSSSLVAIIQELVDRPGWASGNAICLVVKNDGMTGDKNVGCNDYAAGAANAAKLDIDYTAPGDITEQVGASADDAVQVGSSVTLTDDHDHCTSDTNWYGFRFQSVAIPAGATIDSAVLQLYMPTAAEDLVYVDIYGEDVDDSAAFTTGSNNISGRTLTTAKVDWDTANAGAPAWIDSPDISAIIQEIVDRPGWASGQDLAIILDLQSGVDMDVRMWDYTGNAYGARLVLSYTEAAAGLSKPIAMHYYRQRRMN
jgi:hypothetical protein